MNPNLRTIRVGVKPPIDTKNTYNVIMYAGSVFRKEDGTCEITAIQLTSIPKIEPWILEAISRFGLHAIISGGGFGEKVVSAMKEHGCVCWNTVVDVVNDAKKNAQYLRPVSTG